VNYPGLPDNKYHALAKKYLPKGASGLLNFGVKGGAKAGERFIDAAQFMSHLGEYRRRQDARASIRLDHAPADGRSRPDQGRRDARHDPHVGEASKRWTTFSGTSTRPLQEAAKT
jgi:hypothetical protein